MDLKITQGTTGTPTDSDTNEANFSTAMYDSVTITTTVPDPSGWDPVITILIVIVAVSVLAIALPALTCQYLDWLQRKHENDNRDSSSDSVELRDLDDSVVCALPEGGASVEEKRRLQEQSPSDERKDSKE